MAKRFNQGKTRLDLLHPRATQDMAEAFTFGANKYGDYNWHKGMEWTKMIASAKRHLLAIERGEDYDSESGLLHVAHLAANIHMLNAYYYIYPMGDDRIQNPLARRNIAIDIEIIADSYPASVDLNGKKIIGDEQIQQFYTALQPSVKATDFPFRPICYISDRTGVDDAVIVKWLKTHDFNIYTPIIKRDEITSYQIDIVIHTNYETYLHLREAGMCVYLWDMPYNRFANVGHFRMDLPKLKSLFG